MAGENEKVVGVVKWFNASKGYGFIAPKEGGPDIFAHYSGIIGSGFKKLEENQLVEFTMEKVAKGFQATDIIVLEEPEAAAV
jgi:CspA family cold shock protein